MKQTRRQELKTNDLSVYLKQVYEAAVRNATYLIGGVAVVVLVLVVGLWTQYSRHATREEGWKNYNGIRSANVMQEPGAIDRAKSLAAEFSDDPDLGPLTLILQGDLAYERAMTLTDAAQQTQRVKLLQDAQQTYAEVIAKYGTQRTDTAAGARMSLAAVKETLLVAGQGDLEEIRKIYQELSDGPTNPFQQIAAKRLETLDERVAKLEIVPTPPPATAPATAPTTGPATTPRIRLQPKTATTTPAARPLIKVQPKTTTKAPPKPKRPPATSAPPAR